MAEPGFDTASVRAADRAGWQLEGIRLLRGNTTVFDDLTLELREQRIGLIGHNGAGKTSLLRMLAGLELPVQGRMLREGVLLHGDQQVHGPSPLVGLMFQNPDDQIIYPTVEEELMLSWQSAQPEAALRRGRAARQAALAAVHGFLHERGLMHWAPRAVSALSQGQRQWLCWLAMLLAQPQVLLLDEPFASLDLPGQLRLAADIEACAQQVIVSTHVLDHVRDWPRVLWLEAGQVRADGPGHQVCAAYEASVREGAALGDWHG